ncbi:hypothetical protein [Metabacillus fastidiosus]|uniref:IDEAL domain-containing protein n=1 Tax=Metabacillus fastidiosus TaxID=1458 RepID=A0ABU6P1N5_9BACI|nr:hypothetical protein [Metabacillus fastidiosus]
MDLRTDMELHKDGYLAKIRAKENRIKYLEMIIKDQREALRQKDEIIQQILENNLSESEKFKLFEKAVPYLL